MARKPKRNHIIPIYSSYSFIDKDPVIDEIRTMIGETPLWKVSEDCDVRVGTIRGWLFGKTKRPQSASIEAVGRGLGFQRKWVRFRG